MSDGKFIVKDTARNNQRECDSRAEAESKRQDLIGLGANSADVEIIPPGASDGGESAASAEVVEDSGSADAEAPAPAGEGYDLPESVPVDTDPLVWMPDEFTDTIDGTVAINRKGYEVMCQHFGVAVTTEKEIGPYETDHEYAEAKATAKTTDGATYTAYATAIDAAGDDADNLLELADTRAYKRAASRATGVGMIAVEEIQGQL